jgi:hypothetical protein
MHQSLRTILWKLFLLAIYFKKGGEIWKRQGVSLLS